MRPCSRVTAGGAVVVVAVVTVEVAAAGVVGSGPKGSRILWFEGSEDIGAEEEEAGAVGEVGIVWVEGLRFSPPKTKD